MEDISLTQSLPQVDALIKLIETLRGKNGCPWDKKQTPRSMATYLLEETYELLEAIESKKPEAVCEELGDLLFHIFFIARLFQEKGHFAMTDVVSVSVEKMTRRHPHVFGPNKIQNSEEVKHQWHQIKLKEKNHSLTGSITASVPSRLPALIRAYRISERVAKTGFDWMHISEIFNKLEEELAEFKSALTDTNRNNTPSSNISAEFGDILFTLVNVARFLNIHPESSLTDAIKKFENRFKLLERIVSEKGKRMDALSSEEMDRFWNEAKERLDDSL